MEESPASKLVAYLDHNLISDELAGLLDLLSHFDEPVVHAKIRQHVRHEHDLVKGAAVLAMANLSGDQWDEELGKLLMDGDPTQSGFAAKAIATRKTMRFLPQIQELHKTATGATKDFYREAIERMAPRA
jgi:hypothetical protein